MTFERRIATILSVAIPLLADTSVRVESGLLAGAAGSTPKVRIFKAIPYAAPPIGELRWKAPVAVTSWQGARDPTKFSATCYQRPYPEGSPYRSEPEPISEDCLYLNVAIGDGKTLDQLATTKDNRPFSTSLQLPRSVEYFISLQTWKLPTQVQDIYEEIVQGKPHGEIAGGK